MAIVEPSEPLRPSHITSLVIKLTLKSNLGVAAYSTELSLPLHQAQIKQPWTNIIFPFQAYETSRMLSSML